eukprot:Blabericola_migrator_1__2112@NODE_1582_length_4235_cov_91_013436_g1034_i0_p1_GENE_NODE_1582_length_4235_cov_91_013436_g1034_i0NODE_1582_length_4235_cov_91_013436_g1034_i0_p1_ORF_typecomplete_len556_score124_76YopYscD_cpl/PF16697_5/1_6e10FHA/PF00498_26/2e10DUF1768/PF08719_11/2_5e10RRM_3/PF08777_11/5_2e02RRM_3/PF08777_11/0_029RRM_1/PF00076_22/3_8e03RRM_1/PF00076_22/0_02DUF2017/PF09438_10/0_02FHA_2/PF17913_1/0_099Limkainb1/PF11608_8/0_092RRM_occluded/PF16842_5/0_2DUF4523/PF15023_6/3_6e03DUF4523/PF1
MGLSRRLDLRDETGKPSHTLHRDDTASDSDGETLVAETHGPDTVVESLNAITNFVGDFDFLHPDYPACVASPVCVSDIGDFQPCRFFPSVAAALACLHHKIDMEGLTHSKLLSDDESKSLMTRLHSDIKDAIDEQESKKSQRWEAEACVCVEQLTRDKFKRHKQLCIKLLATGDRPLIYSDATHPLKGMRDVIIEPDSFWGKSSFSGENIIGRVLVKVREDMRQGHRGLMRWLIQLLPIERDNARRLKLKVYEGKTHTPVDTVDTVSETGQIEHIATHELSHKYDIREYFESSMKVDRQQLFVTFPDNEKEDTLDTLSVWRKRKKQKLLDELTGGDTQDDTTASSMMITIGKQAENEITCLNPSVSRSHVAIIPLQRSRVVAIDLGSKGGTQRNGEPMDPMVPVLLQPGDRLRVGHSARVFTVHFRALTEQDLIRLKREELERRLSSLNASINSAATSQDASEKSRTIKLEGLAGNTETEDIEDALAAFALQAERIQLEGGYQRSYRRIEYNGKGMQTGKKTALVIFKTRKDAWKARESLNDRGVKGRTVHASWV